MIFLRKLLRRPFFIRLFHWEFWPFLAVYAWVFPYWGWVALRCRSLFFFNAVNPSIENGGLLNESKKDIHAILPPDLYPRTEHFTADAGPDTVLARIEASRLRYPLIGKPDIGGKGRGIRKLHDKNELADYARRAVMDFHIQEFVPYGKEVGIFYYRYPGELRGKVSGIVRKEFLQVKGDGRRTIRELMQADMRGIMYLEKVERSIGETLDSIPGSDSVVVVSPVGNHARGALFLDESALADEMLERRMDSIADRIPGFHFGRLDIRYRDWEVFKRGEDFVMIEVNGAGAEPTHMYDPSHSIFFAWKEIVRHWRIMGRISRINHRNGVPYLKFRQGVGVFRLERSISRSLERMPE
jgi:hypothetical protein